MNLIIKQIKDLFGKQEVFCEKQGYKFKDFASKKRSLQNKLDWINNFLQPLDLEIQIVLKTQKGEEKEK